MWDVARLTSHNNVVIIICNAPSTETSGVITCNTKYKIHTLFNGWLSCIATLVAGPPTMAQMPLYLCCPM